MGLRQRISSWRKGGSEAGSEREQRRRRKAREDAAIAEQKALASSERAEGSAPAKRPATTARSGSRRPAGKSGAGGSKARRSAGTDARKLDAGTTSVGLELAKLARAMVVIPLRLWLAAAEIVGKGVLAVWLRVVLPVVRALGRFAALCLRVAERQVTPARAVAVTGLVAIAALAASQWLDYRSVSVGADAYSGAVGDVAPPPEVETEIAGNAHSWAMLPLALIALVALVVALARRRRVALALVPVGIAVIVISLAVDAPKGLDEGQAAIAYEGASASLLEAFWIQIATGVVLIASGLLLSVYLRPAPAGAAVRGPVGPTPAAVIAAHAKSALGRLRVPRLRAPRRRRGGAGERPKQKVQGART